MDGHNHLDRQVRQRGECPGCDLFWDRQQERLARTHAAVQTVRQLERMADKPRPGRTGLCMAIYDGDLEHDGVRRTHTCNLPAGHPPPHLCPLCDNTWSDR